MSYIRLTLYLYQLASSLVSIYYFEEIKPLIVAYLQLIERVCQCSL